MILRRLIAAAALLLGAGVPASAQNVFPTAGDNTKTVIGVAAGCLDGSGKWIPSTAAGQCAPQTGGSGGAVTAVLGAFADGAIVTMGAAVDLPYVSGAGTLVSISKGIFGLLTTGIHVTATALPLPTNAAQETGGNLATMVTSAASIVTNTGTTNTNLGAPGATACATDNGACNLNALLQRVAQRLTTINTTLSASPGAVSQGGTLPWVVGVTQWGGSVLGAASNYGTSPGLVLVPGVNAFVTNAVAVTGTFWQATQPVSGTFWQTTQPVSGTFWQATQPVSAASLPLPTNAAAETGGNLAAVAASTASTSTNTGTTNTDVGAPGATACATDTGSCSLNALAQRLAQRLTTLVTALGSPLQAGANLEQETGGNAAATTTNTSTTATNTGTIATNSATVVTNTGTIATNTSTTNTDIGPPGVTACTTDTGSCNGNQLWQRIAQRITSLITAVGSPLQAGANIAQETGGNIASVASSSTTSATNSGTIATNTGNTATSASTTATNTGTTNTDLGAPGATACTTDTASCSLNALAQRLAQRLSTIVTTLGSPLQAGANIAQETGGNLVAIAASDATTATNTGTTATNTGSTATSTATTATNTGTVATNTGTTNTDIGAPGATACATDTGSCALNAQMQRLAQRLTTIVTTLGTPFQAGGSVTQGTSPWVTGITQWGGSVLGAMATYGTSPGAVLVPGVNAFVTNAVAVTGTFWQATQPISVASLPLPSNAAQETGGNLASISTSASSTATNTSTTATNTGTSNTNLGPPGATACATDTGSCSLNALLQRLAQRLTTLNTTLGTPMQATGGTVGVVAGTALMGKVGIDQTTPGTTNGTQDASTGSTASAVPAKAIYGGVSVGGNLTGVVGDPCQVNAHAFTPINISTAVNTKIVVGTSAKKTYICHLFLIAAGSTNVGIVEGSGTNCATSTLGLVGGATAATGPNLVAQTGFVLGTGSNAVAATTVNANDVCLITSAAVQLSGVAVTVQQ